MNKLMLFLPLLLFNVSTHASTAYGTLNNFDTVNDTGKKCHGFEIELDDMHSIDVTYTYDWNHYGKPTIREDNTDPLHPKVFIRHASLKDSSGNYAAYTAIPTVPITPTNGHQCTNPAVNEGCEHFGVGYYGSPSAVKYNWLVDDGAGNLVQGPAVNVATPTWTYYPPANIQPAQVVAEIPAPPPPPVPVYEFGDAVWVKEIITTTHNNNKVELKDLVSDDPNVANEKNWKNGEPDEVEVEWQILQKDFNKADAVNNNLAGAAQAMPNGDEVITRRYEFFQYSGGFDPETHEVLCEKWKDAWTAADIVALKPECLDATGQPLPLIGDYIGAQMAGFNVEAPLGLIDNIQDGNVSEPYADRTVVVGGNTPYTTTVLSGLLPNGLTIDSATGVLSGTPVTCGTFSFTVDATDADNVHATKEYVVKILSPDNCPLSVVNGAVVNGEVGIPIPNQILVSGGAPAYIIGTANGDPVPAGLTLNATTGLLSGTAVNAGTANLVLDVTDATLQQSSGSIAINVAAAVGVAPIALPTGTSGVAYPATKLNATDGVTPYSWAQLSGNLPAGMTFNANTGTISGTPTVAGNFTATFQVTDSLGATAKTPSLNLTIVPPLGISTLSLASGKVGTVYSAPLAATGGTSPYVWTLLAGSLPTGLTLSSVGVISGTPSASGSFNATVKVTDGKALTATKPLSLTISPATVSALGIRTTSLTSGTINKSYSATLAATGGTSPYTWTLAGGGLPTGLTLASGKISGKPTVAGTFTPIFKVTDSKGATASKTLSLTINTSSSGGILVDIKGTVGAINTASKYITVGGVNIYYSSTTTMLLNTNAGKITTTGSIPAGVTVNMAVQGKGSKGTAGKITATSLEFN